MTGLSLFRIAINRSTLLRLFFFFQAEDGIRDVAVTGVQTCALPISPIARKILKATNGGLCSASETRGPVRIDLDRTLTALADPTRRAVVDLLRRSPRRPSEVADALDMSRPAMSRHFRVLLSAGLIGQ